MTNPAEKDELQRAAVVTAVQNFLAATGTGSFCLNEALPGKLILAGDPAKLRLLLGMAIEDAPALPAAEQPAEERAQFEAWAELTAAQQAGAMHDLAGWYYFDDVTNDRWEAWQAGRASITAPAPESQPARTLPALTFAELIDSDTFKYTLNELANKGNNPKHQRALVREVREAIKACAAAQRQASAAELYGTDAWIKLETAMPEPYEEVRILVDGVPRIGRLNHRREYFQLCTFLDNVKGQYIASFERVAGWQPLPQVPAAPAMEAKSHE